MGTIRLHKRPTPDLGTAEGCVTGLLESNTIHGGAFAKCADSKMKTLTPFYAAPESGFDGRPPVGVDFMDSYCVRTRALWPLVL